MPSKKIAAKKSSKPKTTAKKSTAKKSTAKKTTAKKTTAKKTTAKKSTAKKSTAKKSTAKKSTGGAVSPERMQAFVEQYDKIYGKGYFEPSEVKCPLCGAGVIVAKRGRFGPEWRCNAEVRPMCKFKLDSKPTGETCSHKRRGKPCGALTEMGTKTIRNRCSDKTCPNRNPHKL